jgi:ABC-type branched-subunit amino acid transport system ATPase component
MARTFQITEIFPELSVADNIRVAVEIAAAIVSSPGSPKRRGRGWRRASLSFRAWAA